MDEKYTQVAQNINENTLLRSLYEELGDKKLRYFIETYGCQMNAHDSEKLAGLLHAMGMTPSDCKENANFILFNTCCVREHAEKRVFGNIGALRKLKEEKPDLILGVCGCMMQQKDAAQRLMKRFPFVNFTMGPHALHHLPEIIFAILQGERVMRVEEGDGEIVEGLPVERLEGVSASINIMYGCNNFCSYCIVPYVRGRERSRESAFIIQEARELVAKGYSELMLLGQNVNSYGKDLEGQSFARLLHETSRIEGLKRIRFMTSHPKDLSDELISALSVLPNVCDHLHLPVQSGNNKILKDMNRKYTREDYLRLVQKLRASNPKIELTTDIIVGFPGETEEEFLDTLALVGEVGFSAAFTFMYSKRSGTQAANMADQVSESEKKERLLRLNALQAEKTRETNIRYIGRTEEVLIEGCDFRQGSMLYGKLSSFKMVYFPGEKHRIGEYANVEIVNMHQNSLIGREIAGKEIK